MLMPKRLKYRKTFKQRKDKGIEQKGTAVTFGTYGLRSESSGQITSRQIESARRAMTHFIKRGGRVWIRIFPATPTTKKPPETRMGGGKGDIHEYVTKVGPGRMLFEMTGVAEETAKEAFRLASHKLPVRSSFVKKEGMN
jgi:large subunit ribosomal protein L16